MKKIYCVYDGRACGGAGTDDALVMVCCNSLKEAQSYKGEYGTMTAVYSYDESIQNNGKRLLINEKWEEDLID